MNKNSRNYSRKVHSKEARKRLRRIIRHRMLRRVAEFFNRLPIGRQTKIAIVAIVVGILGGYGAIAFLYLIRLFQTIFFGGGGELLGVLHRLPWYRVLLPPAIGGLIIGPIIYFLARETKGIGVPEVMEAVALKGGKMRSRIVFMKGLVASLFIGAGGSVGRVGPVVQIGSAAGSSVAQLLGVSERIMKTLVGCGAAAGIAATFNAPIAGVIFSLEVILGDFTFATFGPVVLSSVTATVISRAYLGNSPAFMIPSYQLVSVWEVIPYILLGLIAGVLAVVFTSSLYRMEDLFNGLRVPDYLKATIGGLGLGCVGLFLPYVYGVGFESINLALFEQIGWYILLALFLAKIFSTSLVIGSGGSGGIFAPSLFIGAMAGGLYGRIVHQLFPAVTATSGAYALVGMGALVAGAIHAPITAILILFEMTDDYKIILPLMLACIISTITASQLKKESIYSMKLLRRGVDIRGGREVTILQSLLVKDCMSEDKVLIPEITPFSELVKQMLASRFHHFPVVDGRKRMVGIIHFNELKEHLFDDSLPPDTAARDMAYKKYVTVTPEENLLQAIKKFGTQDLEEITVVSERDPARVVGTLSLTDVMQAYNKEVSRRMAE